MRLQLCSCPVPKFIFFTRAKWAKNTARYLRHFAHPILHEQDMQHEELP